MQHSAGPAPSIAPLLALGGFKNVAWSCFSIEGPSSGRGVRSLVGAGSGLVMQHSAGPAPSIAPLLALGGFKNVAWSCFSIEGPSSAKRVGTFC